MLKKHFILILGIWMLAAGLCQGQDPPGEIHGRVTSGGDPLPGATLTATSPALAGDRVAISSGDGSYRIPFLPPGRYKLTAELEGLETVRRKVEVTSGGKERVDFELPSTDVFECPIYFVELVELSEDSTSAQTVSQELPEKLALRRDIDAYTSLAPGTAATGPGGRTSISGVPSFNNLYLIDGAPVMENIRGQAADVFIEGAIEKVQTSTGGVSAEYGRFSGGVVEVFTRSGGNRFTGSFRDSLESEKWSSRTPAGEERADSVDETYELTLGGYLVTDRLWFFAAGRDLERSSTGQTAFTHLPYPTHRDEERLAGTLTWALTPQHQLQVSAVDVEDRADGISLRPPLDLGAITNGASFPEELLRVGYSGRLTDRLSLETRYSERSLEILGVGGTDRDFRSGTPFVDARTGAVYHQPIFCGDCDNPDDRTTEHALLAASYLWSGKTLGSHVLDLGADTYSDIRSVDNHQSATDLRIRSAGTVVRGDEVFPVMGPGASIEYSPILAPGLGAEFRSDSAWVNDRWALGERWSFNLGLRYDRSDGENSDGLRVVEDDSFSPRLGVSFDPRGDGATVLHASLGRYVGRLAGTIANRGASGGVPLIRAWPYFGPAINADPEAEVLVSADDALDIIFDWFLGSTLIFPPLVLTTVDGSLASPDAEEATLGLSRRLGARGRLRLDYVHRDFGDFYFLRRDTTTGSIFPGCGFVSCFSGGDLALLQNDDELLERTYDGLQSSFRLRLSDRLAAGGSWTWSRTRGNFDGETRTSGPISARLGEYPEYKAFAAHNPRGDLSVDQRHKVRAWLLWDAVTGEHHRLDLGLYQSYSSGTPYGAVGAVDSRPFVAGPLPYVTPPGVVTYFFTGRDAFRTDEITRTDLSLNCSFLWNGWGRSLEAFVQPEVLNVFDESGVVGVDTTVLDATSSPGLERFDPFIETPVEGVHWVRGPGFGRPRNDRDYQRPRTFRVSLGLRF